MRVIVVKHLHHLGRSVTCYIPEVIEAVNLDYATFCFHTFYLMLYTSLECKKYYNTEGYLFKSNANHLTAHNEHLELLRQKRDNIYLIQILISDFELFLMVLI